MSAMDILQEEIEDQRKAKIVLILLIMYQVAIYVFSYSLAGNKTYWLSIVSSALSIYLVKAFFFKQPMALSIFCFEHGKSTQDTFFRWAYFIIAIIYLAITPYIVMSL